MSREAGQTTIFVLGMTLVVMAVAGVAVDGTRAFLHRRTLQNTADAAALAAAVEIDRSRYYRAGAVVLAEPGAGAVAARWVARHGVEARAQVRVEAGEVRVLLRAHVPAGFLRIVGIARMAVAAEARASPLSGAPR